MSGATLFTDHFGPLTADVCGSIQRIADLLASSELETIRITDLEAAAIRVALDKVDGNRTHAAKLLGISVRTLQRKLKTGAVSERNEPEPAMST
jgi:DNA-binding NtrC family response regulator